MGAVTAVRIGAPALAEAVHLDTIALGLPDGPARAACLRCTAQARRAVGHLGGQPVDRARGIVVGIADHLGMARQHAAAYGAFHRDPVMDRREPGQEHTPRQRLTGILVQLADRIEAVADWLAATRIRPALASAAATTQRLPELGAIPAAVAAPAGPDGLAVVVLFAALLAVVLLAVWLIGRADHNDPATLHALATWSLP